MLKSDRTLDGILIASLTPGSDQQVELTCDGCGEESVALFRNYARGEKRWGGGASFCRPCASKRTGEAKVGKRINVTPTPARQGARSGNWKGGRFIASDGYVMVYVGPRRHRKEHFLVMERHLGRPLARGEIVHHIDTDKLNNALDNLLRLPSESAHQQVHVSLRRLAGLLIQQGLIGFDRGQNRYVAVGKLRELLGQPEEANQQPSPDGDAGEGSTTRYESL